MEGLGNYRQRDSSSQRSHYDNWFGGALGGFNYGLSCDSYLNFFFGGSWGRIDIHDESNFDSDSVLFGMTYERLCDSSSFAFAIAGGYLTEERHFSGVHEEPRGVFLTPELTYAYQFACLKMCPIFATNLRYAGFFPRDYQHRETSGTLYVQKRSIQLLTLRGELATTPFACMCCFQPYIGVAGRFQLDGNHVKGRLLQDRVSFSDGINNSTAYGMLGLRATKQCRIIDFQANLEGEYDSDKSWRILGGLSLNYAF